MSLALVTSPSIEPITAQNVKDWFGDDGTSDAVLGVMITAARQVLEGSQGILGGRCFITQTWDYTFDGFPFVWEKPFAGYRPYDVPSYVYNVGIVLPLRPVQSITSISYRDTNGTTQVMSSSDYRVTSKEPATVMPVTGGAWPTTDVGHDSATIRFVAGYGSLATDVPMPIRSEIGRMVNQDRKSFVRDPSLRSETVEGVGSFSYETGLVGSGGLAGTRMRLQPYVIGGIS